MGYFKRGHKQGGQSRGGSRRGGSDWNKGSDQKINYKTRCADCGNDCTVPFRPNGSKPVLCRDCFGGGDRRSSGGRSFNKPSFDRRPAAGPDVKKDLKRIEEKVDEILSLLKGGFTVETEGDADETISFDE